MPTFTDRLAHAWNAFMNRDPTPKNLGPASYYRPDRPYVSRMNDKSMVTSVYNKIAIDASAISIRHIRLDENGRYKTDMDSSLNDCLTVEANLDQTGRAFRQDLMMSLLEEGVVAVCPIDTNTNPKITAAFDIHSMRVGRVTKWYPNAVTVDIYNELDGKRHEKTFPKKMVAIIQNPFYSVMNEPNSTLKRLTRKLALLDAIDEQSSLGKLDMIIQLPYAIKTDAQRKRAEERRKDIETQMTDSKFGIAYVDSTERITQLNRSLENNLMKQIEYLTNLLYSQLGITQGVLDGSADEKTMTNYYSRTIEPILSSVVDEMKRKFLTKTARSQGQSIGFFRDPFMLVPVSELAEMADKFTRNEVMTSNEVRQAMGMKPSNDPKADQLVNSNISQPNDGGGMGYGMDPEMDQGIGDEEIQNGMSQEEYQKYMNQLNTNDQNIAALERELGGV